MARTVARIALVRGLLLGGIGWGTLGFVAAAAEISFSGFTWRVRVGEGGPGPNVWDARNVWRDDQGHLHLKIRHENGRWSCAEVVLDRRLGFGRYVFEVGTELADLDAQVVLGLFNYPPSDVGADGTHEIDLEFARWGRAQNPVGNYTVWPVEKARRQVTHPFAIVRGETPSSTHTFEWRARDVRFRSWRGTRLKPGMEMASWTFSPPEPALCIAQRPMPVHLNLWLFRGRPPTDGREVEIVLRSFRFEPAGE